MGLVLAVSAWAGASERAAVARVHPATRPSSSRFVALPELAERIGVALETDAVTGVHRLRRGDLQVAATPGVAAVLVGSDLVALHRAPVVHYGHVYVPRSVEFRIERLFGYEPAPGEPGGTGEEPRPGEIKPARCLGRVCIDAGHGGRDPGALSPWGLREKDVVLPTARLLASQLRQRGFEVVMTREGDELMELNDRPAFAARERADLFVSVHANSIGTPAIRGIEIFYPDAAQSAAPAAVQRTSVRLAETLRQAFESDGLAVRKVTGAGYRVLRLAPMPAALVEIGFLSNRADERLLRTTAYRERIARAMAEAIEACRPRR